MKRTLTALGSAGALLVALGAGAGTAGGDRSIALTPLGTYASGHFDGGGAEIAAFDETSDRIFVANAADASVDILDAADPAAPARVGAIDVTPFGPLANSVAVHDGVVAVAIEADPSTAPGTLAFFDANGGLLSTVQVGAQPDMVTFTPGGDYALVANEGEPNDDYTVDPEGSVSIVDLREGASDVRQSDVRTAGFGQFARAELDPSIRVYGPGANVAQDLEPEYIAVSGNGKTAWVSIQEANALGVLDIKRGVFTALHGLGFKDWSLPANQLDSSDRDGGIRLASWPVKGMFQPDGIASYRVKGNDYIVSANEGDARDYDGFSEEKRLKDVALDPAAFPDAATLRQDGNLGRLRITTANGDADGDGLYEELYAYGARSFSIWSADGALVWDSGAALERITAAAFPADFNSDNDENDSLDARSDDKGPEPEGVAVGKVQGRWFAFVGLERIGGIVVFDITDPQTPRFVEYVNNRDFAGDAAAGTAGDLGPEGIDFVPGDDSPTGRPLLVVGNEVSGTTTVYQVAGR